MWGNDGDDVIRPQYGYGATRLEAHGGKGDDLLNEVIWNEEEGKFGFFQQYEREYGSDFKSYGPEEYFNDVVGGSTGNGAEFWFGEQGDDKMFAGGAVTGDVRAYGGTGDDYLVGGIATIGDTFLYGGANSDLIRSDFYRYQGDLNAVNTGNEYIFGDYKYGADALDKDLFGDDDVIFGGYG